MKRSFRWVWVDPVIGVFTCVMATLSVFFSLFDGKGNLQHWCARTWARFILWISGAEVTIEGLAHVPADTPCLIASNHQSYFDVWTLLARLPIQFRFAAKEELFTIPFLGWHLRRSGNIAIHRDNPRKALRSLREAGQKIGTGVSVLIFPEGTRSTDGRIAEFKKGVFLLAVFSGVPIVPVTIMGSRALLPKGSFKIRSGAIQVVVSPPIPSAGVEARDLDQLVEKVRTAMISLYQEGPVSE